MKSVSQILRQSKVWQLSKKALVGTISCDVGGCTRWGVWWALLAVL